VVLELVYTAYNSLADHRPLSSFCRTIMTVKK